MEYLSQVGLQTTGLQSFLPASNSRRDGRAAAAI